MDSQGYLQTFQMNSASAYRNSDRNELRRDGEADLTELLSLQAALPAGLQRVEAQVLLCPAVSGLLRFGHGTAPVLRASPWRLS